MNGRRLAIERTRLRPFLISIFGSAWNARFPTMNERRGDVGRRRSISPSQLVVSRSIPLRHIGRMLSYDIRETRSFRSEACVFIASLASWFGNRSSTQPCSPGRQDLTFAGMEMPCSIGSPRTQSRQDLAWAGVWNHLRPLGKRQICGQNHGGLFSAFGLTCNRNSTPTSAMGT
jgi:hypothetical protein